MEEFGSFDFEITKLKVVVVIMIILGIYSKRSETVPTEFYYKTTSALWSDVFSKTRLRHMVSIYQRLIPQL